MFQGSRELAEENGVAFDFEPAAIDYVCLTHAHLDHCGRLPLLSKRGFRGEVIATAATFDLARLVLLDSTHLQMEEARHRQHRAGRLRPAAGPLYSMIDTLDSIGRFGRAARYGMPVELVPG